MPSQKWILCLICLLGLSHQGRAQQIGPKNGSLILAGGGRLDQGIYQRFVDLAGGAAARIVMIPTAGTEADYDHTWSGLQRLEPYGLTELSVLHTRDRQIADSENFVEPLRRATGVWFSGGRQWRLADAYLNTRVHAELQALLERGGVIGGSSAGATIQGSYLVRGDTKTSAIVMGDHTEGLGFLNNVGVDQHLLRRNRQFDLIPVLRKHPELLGIGIDEGTAIVVQGDTFEVIGKSYVAVYEQNSINTPKAPFRLLAPKQKYQMKPQEKVLTEILFGSCIKEDQPMPILQSIAGHSPSPDLFLFLGDNIYADTTDIRVMRQKYQRLADNADFSRLVSSIPILATWDDHDFGMNDAGTSYEQKEASQRAFLDFWQDSPDSVRRQRPGIHATQVFGPKGKRVQVILLDTRFFRSDLEKSEKRIGGPYVPSKDTTKTMLGQAQWTWLEEQLKRDAEIRIIVSSIQLVADDAGQECWANLPHERNRFFQLVKETGAKGIVVVSGDRHWAELSVEDQAAAYPIFDLTSSSLNQAHGRGTPTPNSKRANPSTYHRENYGRIAIDWDANSPSIQLEIIDLHGDVQLRHSVPLADLQ